MTLWSVTWSVELHAADRFGTLIANVLVEQFCFLWVRLDLVERANRVVLPSDSKIFIEHSVPEGRHMKRNISSLFFVALAFSVAAYPVLADETTSKPRKSANVESKKASKKSKNQAPAKSIEMFQAMDQGLLTVDYIGKDATQANLIFRNQTGEPLDVVLPKTFGAVHVLAQGMMGGGMGGMGGGMGGMGGGGMGGMGGGMGGMGGGMGGGQGMGGGMGGMGGGMGGMGGGMGGMGGGMGGMMRVQPDKPQKLTVATLCLEHGKLDPTPSMKYKVVRLEEVNDSPVVAELCKALASGRVGQNTAQAAAWHVANGLTWVELVRKPRVISEYTGIEMFFSRFEVDAAMRLTSLASAEAEKNEAYSSDSVKSAIIEEESIGDKNSK